MFQNIKKGKATLFNICTFAHICSSRYFKMKATVDQDTCIGCGLCVSICPDVFEMNEDGKSEAVNAVTPDLQDDAEEAAGSCPVEAIDIQ